MNGNFKAFPFYLGAATLLFLMVTIPLMLGKYGDYVFYVCGWLFVTLVPMLILLRHYRVTYSYLVFLYVTLVYAVFLLQPIYPNFDTDFIKVLPYSLAIIIPLQGLIFYLSQKPSNAKEILQKKLTFFQEKLAIESDASKQFQLQHRIEEIEKQLRELGG